ncbi:MAG: hypothetical protein HYX68_09465 [Planctomycetes bacterium]|nr:hypothetical protein [Planctomycetota bacterium]
MKRLETVTGYFFACLGFVLAGVSILVVPADAFADYTEQCKICQGNPDPEACSITCCGTSCGNDGVCWTACCKDACGGDTTCENNCKAAAPSCKSHSVCNSGCGARTPGSCASIVLELCSETSDPTPCSLCGCTDNPMGTACICTK